MADIAYRSRVRVERVKGSLRHAARHHHRYLVAERVHGFFAQSCPIYRSIHPQIAVTTELVFR